MIALYNVTIHSALWSIYHDIKMVPWPAREFSLRSPDTPAEDLNKLGCPDVRWNSLARFEAWAGALGKYARLDGFDAPTDHSVTDSGYTAVASYCLHAVRQFVRHWADTHAGHDQECNSLLDVVQCLVENNLCAQEEGAEVGSSPADYVFPTADVLSGVMEYVTVAIPELPMLVVRK